MSPDAAIPLAIRLCEEFLAMADDLKTMSREQALLKQATVLEAYNAVLAAITGVGSLPVSEALPVASSPMVAPAPFDPSLAKLPLADAIVELLRGSKTPMTVPQLWKALEKAGFEANSETPTKSVSWALKKLLKTNPDVFHTGWGHWHIKSKYSSRGLQKLLNSRAGKGGRSKADHVARTMQGVAKAKAGGKRHGRPSQLTPEKVRELQRLLSSGTGIMQSCRAVGIAYSTFQYSRDNIEAWREGDPWPPPKRLAPAEAGNVFPFGRRKKDEAPSGKPESASIEPSKGEVSKQSPSLFEPEASHLGESPAKGREAVPGGGT